MDTSLNSIIFANIRGIYPDQSKYKSNLLFDLAKENKSSLILLTESHLNEKISDEEILIGAEMITVKSIML